MRPVSRGVTSGLLISNGGLYDPELPLRVFIESVCIPLPDGPPAGGLNLVHPLLEPPPADSLPRPDDISMFLLPDELPLLLPMGLIMRPLPAST